MNEVRRGTIISFDATTWLAKVLLDGADVEAIIPAGQWVPQDVLTVDAVVAVLVFGETNTNDGLVLGPYGAVPTWNLPLTLPTLKGLNLGTATGALAGQLIASDKISPGSAGSWLKNYQIAALAANAVAALLADETTPLGLLFIVDVTDTGPAIFGLLGVTHVTQLISDLNGIFSVTAGTAAKTNIYWSVANGRYEIENKRAGAVTYNLLYFGS